VNEGADILADKAISDPKVVSTDISSSLHEEQNVPRGRESYLSRSSFDV